MCIFLKISRNLENWLSDFFFGTVKETLMVVKWLMDYPKKKWSLALGLPLVVLVQLQLLLPHPSLHRLTWPNFLLASCCDSLVLIPWILFWITWEFSLWLIQSSLASWPTCISRDFMGFMLVQWVSILSSWASSLLNLLVVSIMKVLKRSSIDGFFSTISCWNPGGGCREFLGLA